MKEFEFFEHTADLGVRLRGATLPALFAAGARALYHAHGDLRLAGPLATETIELAAATMEDLLHDWLAELLFRLAARQRRYDRLVLEVEEEPAPRLTARLSGGAVDYARSLVNAEVKGVTYHQLAVAREPDGTWQATVIFDV
jgi:SHS2 domain-containing protein